MFSSLVERSVPDVCDSVVIDVMEDGAHYRLANPVHHESDPDPFHDARRMVVQVCLSGTDADRNPLEGMATFAWTQHPPTAAQRLLATAFANEAMCILRWQRSEQRACTAIRQADNLEIALKSSRQIGTAIGIIMALHRVTNDQAFDLLTIASQHADRKLRDIALDVIDTGSLDRLSHLQRGRSRTDRSAGGRR